MPEEVSAAEVAGALGIELCEPCGPLQIIDGQVRVGTVIVENDGRILAVPRVGADEIDIECVLIAATDVALLGRQGPHWRYSALLGWFADAVIPRRGHLTTQESEAQR